MRKLRVARGLKQISVAAEAGLADTRLNALECVRVVGPDRRSVEMIGVAMVLNEQELEHLHLVAAHDRCMREIARNWCKPYQQQFLATALDAVRLLSEADAAELERRMRGLVLAKEGLNAFQTQAEVAMT
jgi:transcriptional regulator with XRE-family HTH domain